VRRPDLRVLLDVARPGVEGDLAHRRRAMLVQLCALIGFGRWLGEVRVAEARTFLAGDWRFYEIPGEPLHLVEEIRWTWRGNVHTFSIQGVAPAIAPTRSPSPAP
jgi:hypothetical protein